MRKVLIFIIFNLKYQKVNKCLENYLSELFSLIIYYKISK